jgi:hypothetical protein
MGRYFTEETTTGFWVRVIPIPWMYLARLNGWWNWPTIILEAEGTQPMSNEGHVTYRSKLISCVLGRKRAWILVDLRNEEVYLLWYLL